jgi:hypothetical protein
VPGLVAATLRCVARIGITGHTNLTDDTAALVAGAIRSVLAKRSPEDLVGVTCLARGADQVFARVVLDLGGSIEVVLPAADYRDRQVMPENVAEFDELLGKAAAVRTMPFPESGPAAYMAASEYVLSAVESVIAVWDGGPSGGYGGTADVVDAARAQEILVTVVWPDGAARE